MSDDENIKLFEDVPEPSTSGGNNIGVQLPSFKTPDGREYAKFPVKARSDGKFQSGYEGYRFKENVSSSIIYGKLGES